MKKSMHLFNLLIVAAMFSCTTESQKSLSTLVTTNSGQIEGFYDESNELFQFLGVPYAQPPIGELRWKAPQPLTNWDGIREAKKFGNRPMQKKVFDDIIFRSENQSEDCLYLNVWTPFESADEGLPVLVYFHGGGLFVGSGDEGRYDGASLAKKGIVVVTVNYRLNVFGNFAHPELSQEAEYQASGNYGFLDQVASLKWVKENIKAFGGDPTRVTIAGESAGSVSVSSLITSPLSKDLIAGAIGQSGAAIPPTMTPVSLDQAEKEGVDFAKQFGYDSLAQLRTLSTSELFDLFVKSGKWGFNTVYDNYFYSNPVVDIYSAQQHADIPLMAGWTSAEIPGQGFLIGEGDLKANFQSNVKNTFPDNGEEIFSKYPTGSDEEIMQSATQLASDNFIVYATWKWANLHNKNSNAPVYRYVFDQVRPTDQLLLGAPHASDIEYLLGNLHLVKLFDWRDEDYKVSETTLNHVANFVKTGNPNGPGVPEWPAMTKDGSEFKIMRWDVDSQPELPENDDRFYALDKAYSQK